MKAVAPLIALLALAGCKDDGVEASAASTPEDTCGAAEHQALVGQNVSALEGAGLTPSAKLRVLGPDTMATMDFRSDRLNVKHDEDGVITALTCG